MAALLIEQWRLVVLCVRLDLSERAPAVTTELVAYADGNPYRLWRRRDPVSAYGLGSGAAAPTALVVPHEVRDAVAESLSTDLSNEASLWLRLIPSYGFLGAVPWEETLLAVSDVPLVRVPDRLPVASDPGQAWSAAIAVSAEAGSSWAAPYLQSLLSVIAATIPAPRDVHVFADAGTADQLLRTGVEQPWIHLHRPAEAVRVSEQRSSRGVPQFRRRPTTYRTVGSPPAGRVWADWIADGLAGYAVRTFHVVLNAVWDKDQPILALSPDPNEPADRKSCAYVTAEDVRSLTDVIGAATLSFGSSSEGSDDLAARVIADDVGRQRAGPTLFSSVRQDPTGTALAGAFQFIAAPPGSSSVPRHPSLFAYLQPEHVRGYLRDEWPQPAPSSDASTTAGNPLPTSVLPDAYQSSATAELSGWYAGQNSVPSWVGASERFIDTELSSLTHTAGEVEPGPSFVRAYDTGTAEALNELQEMVARHARPT